MDWDRQANHLLSEGIIGNHVRAELVQRIARLLQIEAELDLAAKAHIDDINVSPTPGFDMRVASQNTVEELVKKYRDVCGALVCASEEKVAFNRVDSETPSVNDSMVNMQINEWLTQSQQRQVMALMPKNGQVH